MKHLKLTVLVLTFLFLVQLIYFGLNDCNVCEFRVSNFFDRYKKQCLNIVVNVDRPELNFAQVMPRPELKPMEYINDTKN